MIQSDRKKEDLIKTVNSKTWSVPKRQAGLLLMKTIALNKGENFQQNFFTKALKQNI